MAKGTKAEHTAIPANGELVKAVDRIIAEVEKQNQQNLAIGRARVNELAHAFRNVDKAPETYIYDHSQQAWVLPPVQPTAPPAPPKPSPDGGEKK